MSFARFSSRTSRSSALIVAASVVVTPPTSTASILACFTQPRKVSEFTPTRCLTRITAAFNDNDVS
jgi:hypothetical protein